MVGKSLAALVGGAAVVTGAGKDLDGVFGVETSASAAGVGSEDSPVGVVGASGEFVCTPNMNRSAVAQLVVTDVM